MKHSIFRVGMVIITILASHLSLQSQTFNNRYDPVNSQVVNPLWLPQNVTSLAENPNTGKIITVANFDNPILIPFNPTNQDGIIQAVGASGSPTTYPEGMHVYDNSNKQLIHSVTMLHNTSTSEIIFAGAKQRVSGGIYYDNDMVAHKVEPLGLNPAYYNTANSSHIRIGTNSTEEEARLVLKDDPSSNTYLLVGVSDAYGVNNPYIAQIVMIGNTATLNWARIYPVNLTDGAEPTSAFRDGNGDFYITGEYSSDKIFAFKMNSSGIPLTNYIIYDTEGEDRMPFIDQNSSGNTIISYTTGNSNATVMGLMNVSPALTTVNWNKTYSNISTTYGHAIAAYHSSAFSGYMIGVGFSQVNNGQDGPGVILTDLSGNPAAAVKYKADANYDRTQAMIPFDDGYILKTLYRELDGHGLVKVDQFGSGINTCLMQVEIAQTSITTDIGATYDDPPIFGAQQTIGLQALHKEAGTSYDCATATPIAYAPYVEDDEGLEVNQNPVQVGETTATSIDERTEKQELSVYPNPNTGKFSIGLNESGAYTFEVMSSTGQRVLIGKGEGASHLVDLSKYEKGIYLLYVKQGEQYYSARVMVD